MAAFPTHFLHSEKLRFQFFFNHKTTPTAAILLSFTFFTSPVFAESFSDYDFGKYIPTLDKLFEENASPIKSGYNLTFTETDKNQAELTYYKINADNNLIPVYYKLNLNYPVNGAQNYGIINGGNGGADINGSFFDNSKAITNTTSVGKINADFINNTPLNLNSQQNEFGGAIYNSNNATISSISGDFINNHLSGTENDKTRLHGGAIANTQAKIGDIKSNFINNFVYTKNTEEQAHTYAYGGAIYNYGIWGQPESTSIGNITGNFIGNYARTFFEDVHGGAIYNEYSTIGNITGNFINNYTLIENNQRYSRGGAIYSWQAIIGDITGNFINNYSIGGGESSGGAISLFASTMGNIKGNFIANHVSGTSSGYGGAIYNWGDDSKIAGITGSFYYNYAEGTRVEGGAIYNNESSIGKIVGDFFGNYVLSNSEENGIARGGAIYDGTDYASPEFKKIEGIEGSFYNNYAESERDAAGGAIYNAGPTIEKINGGFYNNYVKGENKASGGAIYNAAYIHEGITFIGGILEGISDNFEGNRAEGKAGAYGGAIYNESSATFEDYPLSNTFKNNYVQSADGNAYGGAIANMANNYIDVSFNVDWTAEGINISEPIFKFDKNTQSNIKFTEAAFEGNKAVSSGGNAYGGAIAHVSEKFSFRKYADGMGGMGDGGESDTTPQEIMSSKLTISNSVFINNSATSEKGEAKGGAVYSNNNIDIIADNGTTLFKGNTANGKSNAVYMAKRPDKLVVEVDEMGNFKTYEYDLDPYPVLSLSTVNNGIINIHDGIDGDEGYKILLKGDGTGTVWVNNGIVNAGEITVNNTTLKLGSYEALNKNPLQRMIKNNAGNPRLSLNNATLDLFNKHQDTIELADYSATDSYLHLDVDVENMTSDKLIMNGNVQGTTKLVLYPTSDKDITGLGSIVFAQSTNDSTGNKNSFEIFRIYTSPYMFDINYKQIAEGENQWSFAINDTENPDHGITPEPDPEPDIPNIPNKPVISNKVYSEVMVYTGLHAASIEQSRSMIGNIKSKVAANKVLPDPCLPVKDEAFDGSALYNAWVNPIYHYANIKAPMDMDADIWGLEAGFDIQNDIYNKIGIFASYRKGNYDLSGNGNKFYSPVGSEIDIDSYIGGLYYRYDYRHLWTFATVYGGVQKADIKTDDGIKADTNGTQLGASVETGYIFNLSDTFKLEPSLGASYTQIDFDKVKDRVGKTAKYTTIRQTEIELALKFEKYFNLDNGIAKIYAKPSIIQVMTSGNKVKITGFDNKVSTYDDGTLGRFELGGRYAITNRLSAYGYINYTFGNHYDATSAGVGLNYSF